MREFEKKRVRHYEIDGWLILVGKTDRDNDYVSTILTQDEDLWFHVEGCPGSHGIICHREGLEPPRSVVEVAASAVAYYSKARNAKKVLVGMTLGANVSKKKGLARGQVLVKKMKSIKVVPSLPEA